MSTVDHSRVELMPIDGTECSDYINANYIAVSGLCWPHPLPLPLSLEYITVVYSQTNGVYSLALSL